MSQFLRCFDTYTSGNWCVADRGRLYPAYHFIPSRFNVADDPTRHKEVRPAVRRPPPWINESRIVQWLLELPPVSHKVGAWTRLVLRLEMIAREDKTYPDIACLAAGNTCSCEAEPAYCRLRGGVPETKSLREWLGFDFDSTLGFPGEGPATLARTAWVQISPRRHSYCAPAGIASCSGSPVYFHY